MATIEAGDRYATRTARQVEVAEGGGRRAEAELSCGRGTGPPCDHAGLPCGGGDGGAHLLEEREVGVKLRHEHEQPVGQRVNAGWKQSGSRLHAKSPRPEAPLRPAPPEASGGLSDASRKVGTP